MTADYKKRLAGVWEKLDTISHELGEILEHEDTELDNVVNGQLKEPVAVDFITLQKTVEALKEADELLGDCIEEIAGVLKKYRSRKVK